MKITSAVATVIQAVSPLLGTGAGAAAGAAPEAAGAAVEAAAGAAAIGVAVEAAAAGLASAAGAAIELGVALLAAEALDLGDGDALHPDARQCFAHFVELEWLDDGRDEFHGGSWREGADQNVFLMPATRVALARSLVPVRGSVYG